MAAARTGKPLVLCRADSTEDPLRGISSVFLDRLRRHFDVIFHRDLDATPDIGTDVVGAVILGGGLEERLALLPNLKVAANHGVGTDHINMRLFRERGVKVTNTPDVLTDCTADMGLSLMMASARNLNQGIREAMSPEPVSKFRLNHLGVALSSATLGIIGMGRIGQAIADRARACKMTVLYHNRRPRTDYPDAEYHPDLHEMLPQCDFVIVACALSEATINLISRREFALMKDSTTFINIARGQIVDHDALAHALQNKQIRAAALDVTYPEPLPRDHPLLRMDNVIITPHWGSATLQTRTKMQDLVIANLLAGINDKPLVSEVQ